MSAHLKLLRIQNGLTLDQLAQAAGLTRSYLSKVERGLSSPSIASALHLAKALNVTVEELFHGDAPQTLAIQRAPAAEPTSARPVTGPIVNGRLSAFVMRPSHNPLRNPSSRHSGEEIVYVLNGSVELQLSARTEVLGPGDSAHFDSAIPHKISSLGETEAQILIVIAPPLEVKKSMRGASLKPSAARRPSRGRST
jgi:transcriptional regulator with XRE-family HTH domain